MREKMLLNRILPAVLAAVLSLAPGVEAADTRLAARINDAGIPLLRLDRSFDSYLGERGLNIQLMSDPEKYSALKGQLLDTLIGQELLWQAAEANKSVVAEETVRQTLEQLRAKLPSKEAYETELMQGGFTEESFAEDVKKRLSVQQYLRETVVSKLAVTDAEITDYYKANEPSFTRPEQVRARHILVKVDSKADEDTRTAARERLEAIRVRAVEGEHFAALAQHHSEGPSATRGGDLGFFERKQMVPTFSEAAFALETGAISDLVETVYGYHIIKLEERRAPSLAPEAEVADQIRGHLMREKAQEAIQKRIQALREQADVEVLAPL